MDQRAHLTTLTRRSAGVVPRAAGAVTGLVIGSLGIASAASAQDAQTVTDAESSRAILLVIVGLVVLGLALAAVTVWFWRTTRPEHPALAPLEVMGDRGFTARSAFEQRQVLDAVRPEGAEVGSRSDVADDKHPERADAALDLQRLVHETPTTFEDLKEPVAEPTIIAAPPEVPAEVPAEIPAEVPVEVAVESDAVASADPLLPPPLVSADGAVPTASGE